MRDNSSLELSHFQKQMILGSLLGSMYMRIMDNSINPRLQFAHNVLEKDYFDFKIKSLENIMSGSETCNENTHRTQSHAVPCLKPLYDLTHVIGKKVITQPWVDGMIDPVALAMFFMDSGGVTNGGKNISFSMSNSTNNECLIVQNWLRDRWGIESHIYFREGSFKPGSEKASRRMITLTKKDSISNLLTHIKPYITPSIQRKIDKLAPHYRGQPKPPCLTTEFKCDTCGQIFETVGALGGHANTHRRDHVELTRFQKQIILGSLLGDMSISRKDNGDQNASFAVSHSIKQREYITWMHDMLKNLSLELYEHDGSGYGEGTRMISFASKKLPCLNPIYDMTHRDGKKKVTKEWLDAINHPVALAVWFIDDGSRNYRDKTSTFSVGHMDAYECILLSSFMKIKWDINIKIYTSCGKVGDRDNTCQTLKLDRVESLKLRKLIEPYVPPSMMYKIDNVANEEWRKNKIKNVRTD